MMCRKGIFFVIFNEKGRGMVAENMGLVLDSKGDRGDVVDVGEGLGMGGAGCWPLVEGGDAT